MSTASGTKTATTIRLNEWDYEQFSDAALPQDCAKLLDYESALNVMEQGVVMFDQDQNLVFSNPSYARLYGVKPEQIRPGMHISEVVRMRIDQGVFGDGGAETYLKERLAPVTENSDRLKELSDGRTIMVRRRLIAGGGYVATHIDHSARIRMEDEILHMAKHDALTGLVNRFEFHNRAEAALARVRRGETIALLNIDLDNFKLINDTYGHAAGDAVLQNVANQLTEATRETDTVARLGGDEFSILQVDVNSVSDVTVLANRLLDSIRTRQVFDGFMTDVDASIGVTLATPDNNDLEELIRQSDVAMYHAKSGGSACFFDSEMNAAITHRRDIGKALRSAIINEHFEIYYQPILDLTEGRVSSMEALLRWHHPERGMLSPAEFIPIAEETGLVVAIGEWVLTKACKDALNWPDRISVAVNVSAAQLSSSRTVDAVRSALDHSGLPPHRLHIEITESLLISNINEAKKALFALSDIGVKLSLDDFGTGYSSLSHLSHFPFDKIKLDRSFVSDLPGKQTSLAILRAVAGLGRSLNVATTAEGVETLHQLDIVTNEGCSEVQGYFLSPPCPMSQTHELIRSCERKVHSYREATGSHVRAVDQAKAVSHSSCKCE